MDLKNIIGNSALTLPLYLYLRNKKNNKTHALSDEEFAQYAYRKKCGKSLDLKNPQAFDEKIWWLKLYDENPLYKTCTDKLTAREYVRSCGYGDILTNIGETIYKSYKDIEFSALPDKCVIKCNHTSGCNALFDRSKPFDYKKFRREFAYWMQRDYYWESREYNYKGIEPKIFWEEFIDAPENAGLIDYRFMCFGGIAQFVMVDIGIMDVGGGALYKCKAKYIRQKFYLAAS